MGRKAIFLDRDGVINREVGDHVWLVDDIEINEGVGEALAELKERGYIFVVITNQSGIAKGLYTHDDVNEAHSYIRNYLADYNVSFVEMYYCPHHPSTTLCLCRKPGSLLVEKAIARFDIDPTRSYFIGDRERDVEAAIATGVKPILITANDNLAYYLNLID